MMDREPVVPFAQWQEIAIMKFETDVDTEAFHAVVEAQKVQDDFIVRIPKLHLQHAHLPAVLTDACAFPGFLTITDFRAHLSNRMAAKDYLGQVVTTPDADTREQWFMNLWFSVTGKDSLLEEEFVITGTEDNTIVRTTNLTKQLQQIELTPNAAGYFLLSVLSSQLGLSPDQTQQALAQKHPVSSDSLIRQLAMLVARAKEGTSIRERLSWLPEPDGQKALVMSFTEIETSVQSGRKLRYRMAWNPEDVLGSDVAAFQTEYSGTEGKPQFFSTRRPLTFDPAELLDVHQFGMNLDDATTIGAFFDADADRAEHATVVATMKPVLDDYLAKFAHLDLPAQHVALDEADSLRRDL